MARSVKASKRAPDISKILDDDERIEKVMQAAVRQALREHKRAGNPVAEWRDGKVVWVPADEIHVDDEDQK